MYRRDIGQLARSTRVAPATYTAAVAVVACCCCYMAFVRAFLLRAWCTHIRPVGNACIRLTTCNAIQTHRHMLAIPLPDLQQYLCCTRIRRAVWVTGTRRANYGVWHTDRLRGTLQAAVDLYQSHLARLNNCCMLLRDITQQALTTYHRRVRCRVLSERPCMA